MPGFVAEEKKVCLFHELSYAVDGLPVIKAFLDIVLDVWTDVKHIRYGLYAQQFRKLISETPETPQLTSTELTHILILTISLLNPYNPDLISISHRPRFLMALQGFLSHPDTKIRRLGMLVAEYVSQVTIEENTDDPLMYAPDQEMEDLKAGLDVDEIEEELKPRTKKAGKIRRLNFGANMWDGEGDGKEEARWLRFAFGVRDPAVADEGGAYEDQWMLGWHESTEKDPAVSVEIVKIPNITRQRGRPTSKPIQEAKRIRKVVMLDDDQRNDPLEGYDIPSPSSSRSPSPTPSYLEEVAADPSLAIDSTQKKKVTRPVYISQLIELLKDRDKPESLEMGLKWGESLVRAKRSFGGELGT